MKTPKKHASRKGKRNPSSPNARPARGAPPKGEPRRNGKPQEEFRARRGKPERGGENARKDGGGARAEWGRPPRSRDDRPERAERSERPQRASRPAGKDRPERNDARDRPERPHRADRSHPADRDNRTDRAGRPERSEARESERSSRLWIYGRHAALAALANPERKIKRILAAETALEWIAQARLPQERLVMLKTEARREDFDRVLPDSAVHQGLAVEIEELRRARLRDTCEVRESNAPVLVLDQITDPHNIGAIFRSAAAFGVRAIIVQDRRTPPLAGALAKAAAGAVEFVPCVEVVNISRALEALRGLGYHVAGLAGEAEAALGDVPRDKPVALVLGAEGEGMRRLVAESCDALYRIPISRRMESLNVSNAAAVALYEIGRTVS